MNSVNLVGRMTKDPEIKTTSGGTKIGNFTIAVDRKFKNANGEREADFINCVSFNKTAEFIGEYFTKGKRIGVSGSIQTRKYDDTNGVTHYITEVLVDSAEFVESNNTQASTAPTKPQTVNVAPPAPANDDLPELPFEF